MTNFKAALIACLFIFPIQAKAQTACEAYTVASGDTLRLIAERVYGSRDQSPIIYNANRNVVGGNANSIEIGMRLQIPCGPAGGEAVVITNAPASVIDNAAQTPTAVETPVVASAPVITPAPVIAPASGVEFPAQPAFVSVGMFPPFSDGDGNGLMTEMVQTALDGAAYLNAVSVNPVSIPFDPLMASNDPDVILSFPWIDPGCDSADISSTRSRDLCDKYQFSDPVYEVVMTFFVADRGGLAQATQPSEFAGKRICVPEQYPIDHLQEAGFLAVNATIDRGNSVAECMGKLLSGQTDVVNADYLSVESTYAVLNSQSIIVENPSFTWTRSVHAIANTNNPAAMQTLADFNTGLTGLKDSGAWVEIVRKYLN